MIKTIGKITVTPQGVAVEMCTFEPPYKGSPMLDALQWAKDYLEVSIKQEEERIRALNN